MIKLKKEAFFLACFLSVVLFLVVSCRNNQTLDRDKTNKKDAVAARIAQKMQNAFETAEFFHTSILLPNSMARTNDVNNLIPKWEKKFQESITIFVKNPGIAEAFLEKKLSKIFADGDQYPGLCAIGILREMNTHESLQVIKKHSSHPNKIIAEFTKTALSVMGIEK